jgi:hypothetical protein
MRWAWVIIANPLYLALWIIFSLGPVLYVMQKTKYLKVGPELAKRYDAFVRTDMEKRGNLPIYLINVVSFLPRYIMAWIVILTYCSLIMIIMIGTNATKPMEAWRYNLVSFTLKPFVRLHLWVSGVTKITYQ